MKTSSYEEKIIKILLKGRISFVREKTFSDLKHGLFRFDFYIPSKKIIIEMDGQYHWLPIHGRAALLKQQEHDRIKNSWCLTHDMTLYRIPYWKLNEIETFQDICRQDFLVQSKWHNDDLFPPKMEK